MISAISHLISGVFFFPFPRFSPIFCYAVTIKQRGLTRRRILAWDNRVLGVQSSTKKKPELLIPHGRDYRGIGRIRRYRQSHKMFAFMFHCFTQASGRAGLQLPRCVRAGEKRLPQGWLQPSSSRPRQHRAPERGNFHQGFSRVRKAPSRLSKPLSTTSWIQVVVDFKRGGGEGQK